MGVDILQGTTVSATTLTGSNAFGFTGTEADITGGFSGIRVMTGNGGTLTGSNTTNTWTLDGTPTFDDSLGFTILNFTGFANLQGGSNTDAFNVTAASTFNLLGGNGIDTFDIDATLTGSIDGETGVDILQGTTIDAVVLTGSDADGFAGTEADITLNFDGIQTITGNAGTLTGSNTTNTWALDGTPTYNDGANTLNFTGFANLQGGTLVDTFTVSAASTFNLLGGVGNDIFNINAALTGSIDGETGVDILQGTTIDAVVLTGSDADGFAGTEADITAGLFSIGTITGNAGTLTGSNTTNTGALDGTPTFNDGANTLNFTGFANLQGGTLVDTFTVSAASTFNLLGGVGNDIFNINAALTGNLDGEADDDTINFNSTVSGTLTGGAGGSDNDTLVGPNAANAWVINALDAGTLNGKAFTDVENLTGGSNTDDFTINDTFGVTGSIDGGAGTGVDSIILTPYSTPLTVNLTLAGTNDGMADNIPGVTAVPAGFDNIDVITGTGNDDSLTGFATTAIWTIDGGGTENYAAGGQDLDFSTTFGGTLTDAFNVTAASTYNLLGGAGIDTFDIDATLTGSIDGEVGVDILQGNLINSVFLTGSDADGFAGTEADITLNFDGIGTLTGNAGTLTGSNTTNTWALDGTPTFNDGANTLNFTGFATLQGGSMTDAFNVTAASTFNLLGGVGVDTFDIDATLTGSIDGETGVDILQGTTIDAVVLTSSSADGFAGTEADITLNFDGIQTITGNAGTLTGRNLASTWALDGTPTYNDGAQTLNFTGFANLQGGSNTDAFNVTAASTFNLLGGNGIDTFDIDATLTGSIDGETGVDILQGTTIDAVVLTGSDADGFAGTEADITAGLFSIGTITGNAGTLTGSNTTNTGALDGTPTYNDGANTLNFTGFANLQGGTLVDTFTVSAASTFNLLGGVGNDIFNINAALTGNLDGEADDDTINFNSTVSGTLTGGAGGSDNDTLVGPNAANAWVINALDAGTLNGKAFTDVENLTGGSNTDDFTINDTFGVTGSIDGGAGTGVDSIILTPYSTPLTVNLTLAGTNDGMADNIPGVTAVPAGFDNIDVITGTGNDDSLTGFATTAIWTIDGGGTENYAAGGQDLDFSTTFGGATGSLTGGAGADTFNISANYTGNLIGDPAPAGDGVDNFIFTGTAQLTGSIDGGAFDGAGGGAAASIDVIDFSGTTLPAQTLTAAAGTDNGQSGTITDTPNLLIGTFDNINSVIGNGGIIVGPNADTWWDVTGLDSGTFGNSLANIGVNAFNNFTIQGGTQQDVFIFQNTGRITFGIDGTAGLNYLIGVTTVGTDIFNIANAGDNTEVTYTTPGALTTILTNINIIGSENALIATADIGDDSFTINQNWAGSLNGVGGNDIFTFANAGSVTGAVAGGIGSDTLVGDADGNAFVVTGADTGTLTAKIGTTWSGIENLTGGAAIDAFTINSGATLTNNIDGAGGNDSVVQIDGANAWLINAVGGGTVTDVGGTFANIETLGGGTGADGFTFTNTGSITALLVGGAGTDTLTGDDDGNAFVVTGADAGTLAVKIVGTWSQIENLTGGAGNDSFSLIGANDITGTFDGQGGTDTLDYSAATAKTITLTNIGTLNGFRGTGSSFDNINTIIGSGGTDTLIGLPAPATWVVSGGGTTYTSTNALTFSAIENLTGGTGVDTFNITGAHSGNLSGGAGNDVFNLDAVLTGNVTGGAGANTYNPTVAVVGTVDVTGTDTWNHTAGVSLATTVTGGGSLTIPGTNDAILDIGTGANDLLVLPALTGFTGHLIIGGTLAPAGTDFLSATGIDINSTTINVNTAIDSGGSVTLLAGDLNLV